MQVFNEKNFTLIMGGLLFLFLICTSLPADEKSVASAAKPMIWPSLPPKDCPFKASQDIVGLAFTGKHSDHYFADTWYPSWASDGNMYSPYTDGSTPRMDGGRDSSNSATGKNAATGQAVMTGDDPANLKVYSLGLVTADASPYMGRYPCGSLVYNGVWYYGTYCLAPEGTTYFGKETFNWPWLGPFVGFRISTDLGRTWKETTHTPEKPIFGETGMWGYPVKIGSPHFVDFGKNMEHSPDGKAYLVGQGAEVNDPKPRFGNLSWITGDQVYLIRVKPSIETINDPSQYEYFAGHDKKKNPIWSKNFEDIKPLIDWNNNCGCVTITYNAPLKKYLMCVTDGWPTCGRMNSYILEADTITGPWRMAVYMKDFGEQGYFLNFPSKFISDDGRTAWLCYSANFAKEWRKNLPIRENPPGSHYGLVLQEVKLLDKKMKK